MRFGLAVRESGTLSGGHPTAQESVTLEGDAQVNPETRPRRTPEDDRFRDLFEQCYGVVNFYFARLGFSRDERDELTQEAFLRAYRGLASFRGEARLKTWLFTIAKNVGLNAIRAKESGKRSGREIDLEEVSSASPQGSAEVEEVDREEGGEPALPSGEPSPLEGLLSHERSQLLREALDGLPARMRHTVLLRYGQGLKYREIADLLQVSIQTVRSQLSQARQRLAPILSAQFSDLEPPS